MDSLEREEKMKKEVFVLGCNGKMGRKLRNLINQSSDFVCHAGYDQVQSDFPTYDYRNLPAQSLDMLKGKDVIIDFSSPKAIMEILPYAVDYHIPMVIASTGFADGQKVAIQKAADRIPIFISSNMALSTKRFVDLVKYASKIFPAPYTISIHECHHSEKKDAPSGTAKMLFDAVNEGRNETLIYRFDSNAKKMENEIWVSSERNSSLFCGEHIVTIGGVNDYIKLIHFINDRALFAEGALEAARFILQCKAQLYDMNDLFVQ